MIRHIEKMTDKAETHTVFSAPDGQNYVVQSGSSGELYRVRQLPYGVSYTCTCAWGLINPGSECTHVLAVRIRERMSVLPTGG